MFLVGILNPVMPMIIFCVATRLTKFSETYNKLTKNQFGTRLVRQIHDTIHCLLSIIRYNITQKGLATYVAFCDFSIAFPSIHPGKLLLLFCKENIVGRMWNISGKDFK